jgi:acetolactate synthase I/II/III large subunit
MRVLGTGDHRNFSKALELPIMPQATAKCRSTDINGDQAAFTRALGGHGERVTEPGQIAPIIQRAIRQTQAGAPALLLTRALRLSTLTFT